MEKKNLKKIALSLGLVGFVGVGATLAFFTGQTETLTNTFSMFTGTDNKPISVILQEHAVDDDQFDDYLIHQREGERNATGWTNATKQDGVTYSNLLPGQKIDKDPTVTVKANSANCYVYAKVTNLNQNHLSLTNKDSNDTIDETLNSDGISTSWELVSSNGDTKIYKHKNVVNKSDEDQPLEPIFKYLRVDSTITGTEETKVEFKKIVVDAVAVQADNISDADLQKTAFDALGYTAPSTGEPAE